MPKKTLTKLIILSGVLSMIFDLLDYEFYGVFKAITTGLIVFLAWNFRNSDYPKYNKLIRLGLIFCLLGDVALLSNSSFVWGMAAFLLGHFLFSEAFKIFDNLKSLKGELVFLIVIGIGTLAFLYSALGEFLIPAILYIAVIIYTCWMGFRFSKSDISEKFSKIYLAMSLFVISDILVAIDRFIWDDIWLSLLILPLYWSAVYILADSSTRVEIEKKIQTKHRSWV
ncbi:MAG: lysoplasmalogenase [Flavobacteriales bacterium]